MPRRIDRSPDDSTRVDRRIFFGGALFETAACIALVFLLRWPVNIIAVLLTGTLLTSYNIVFWRTLKKQSAKTDDDNPQDPF